MTALTNLSVIRVLRNVNPHRPNSLDRRRWDLIRDGMSVGEFVTLHDLTGPITTGGLVSQPRWNAVRYLRYMVERGGFIELPGVTFAVRGPRPSRELAPLSTDLSQFTFAPEIECLMPVGMNRTLLTQHLNAAGIDTREVDIDHGIHPQWTVGRDQSLPRFSGAEIKPPPLCGQDGMDQVIKVMRTLKAAGCKITRSCGMHVHVGAKDENADFFRNLFRLYSSNASLIDRLVPKSRRGSNNRFCWPIRLGFTDTSTKEEIIRAQADKFRKLTTQAWSRHRTVEFRHAGGTVEADKACYWIKLCMRFCLAARAGVAKRFASLEELLIAIGCTEDERNYLARRANTLAPQQGAVA
jgi:hypothetical protein